LSELYKESNRKQAEHIRIKLEAISCDILVNTDWDAPLFQFKPEEVELLSKMEHDRYVQERLKAGEKYGPAGDTNKGTNPTLIPWDELSELEKDKDRDSVRGIPELLRIAGFEVYRLKDHAGSIS